MAEKLNDKEKRFLLETARKAVSEYLKQGKRLDLKPGEVPSKKLTEKGACFVTIYKGEELRGCIGSLEAARPLVFDVIDNALNAAFGDPRFFQLTQDELPQVRFSISVLTKPEKLEVKDADDLMKKLVPRKHGLIIQKGYARSTFLPAVWEQLPDKKEFLAHLCMKAGLGPMEWSDTRGMEFQVYEADEFSE